jgi:hypothetical protein
MKYDEKSSLIEEEFELSNCTLIKNMFKVLKYKDYFSTERSYYTIVFK